MVGKWHLCAEDEENLASIRRQWPLGRGFEGSAGTSPVPTAQAEQQARKCTTQRAGRADLESGRTNSMSISDRGYAEAIPTAVAVAIGCPIRSECITDDEAGTHCQVHCQCQPGRIEY